MALTLVTAECFPGLGPDERRVQTYLAVWTVAADASLVTPECFQGMSREEQDLALFAALLTLQP